MAQPGGRRRAIARADIQRAVEQDRLRSLKIESRFRSKHLFQEPPSLRLARHLLQHRPPSLLLRARKGGDFLRRHMFGKGADLP